MTILARILAADKHRAEAHARLRSELHAVAGTDVSRVALDGYRREYVEVNDHYCELVLQYAPKLLAVVEAAREVDRVENDLTVPDYQANAAHMALSAALKALERP